MKPYLLALACTANINLYSADFFRKIINIPARSTLADLRPAWTAEVEKAELLERRILDECTDIRSETVSTIKADPRFTFYAGYTCRKKIDEFSREESGLSERDFRWNAQFLINRSRGNLRDTQERNALLAQVNSISGVERSYRYVGPMCGRNYTGFQLAVEIVEERWCEWDPKDYPIDMLKQLFDAYYIEPKQIQGSDEVTAVLRLARVHIKVMYAQ